MRRPFLLIVLFSIVIGGSFSLAYLLLRPEKQVDTLVLYGNVDVRLVDIGFRIGGQVAEVLFEEGDFVKKGALIARLYQNPYDSQVDEAMANVAALEIQLANTNVLLERRKELIQVGGVSQEDLDNTFTTYEQLLANIEEAKAALEVALDTLSYTESFAPTDGIILTRIKEPGSVVRESDPVVTLSISSPVWIRAFVNEPDLGRVFYGMSAEICTDIYEGKVYDGKVGFISPLAEFTPKSVETTDLRTDLVYRLRIYADNPDRQLVQGMPVTVKLKMKRPR